MDLSAFIFVALAVAWAVYLVPKALKHHDEAVKSRSVDRFSHTMRVLARREPVGRRDARLVVTPGRPASTPTVTAKRSSAPAAAPSPAARTRAARSAAARRRNVLAVLLLATLVVVGLAAFGVVAWAWTAAPVAVVVAWLVTCRLMVRREHGARAAAPVRAPVRAPAAAAAPAAPAAPSAPESAAPEPAAEPAHVFEDTSSMPAVQVPPIDPTLWDPVPVTLPTYVTKPAAARRTVRTIELDDSGVWTSGRTDGDAAIARDAEAAERAERNRRDERPDHRAVGS